MTDSADPYVYPGTRVLKYRLGIVDPVTLGRVERHRAGHPLDLARIDSSRWIDASKISHSADYALLARLIEDAVVP